MVPKPSNFPVALNPYRTSTYDQKKSKNVLVIQTYLADNTYMNEQSSNTKYIVGIRTLVGQTLCAYCPAELKRFEAGTVVQQAEFTNLEEAKRKEAEMNWQYQSGCRHYLSHGRFFFELYRDQFEIFIQKV